MSVYKLLSVALFGLGCATRVHAFTFSFGKAVQCGDFSVSWTGGSPPFSLLLVPAFGTPQNISIPSSAFNNGQGSFSSQLAQDENEQFVAVMSDSTGFNSGGTTGLITVGASEGASCNTTDKGTDFVYSTPSALQQCRPFSFITYEPTNAQLPLTIYGLVPSGSSFVRQSNTGTFEWTANAEAGTTIIFLVVDSSGRQGGATDVLTVGRSDISSCLDNSSPSTTPGAPTQTGIPPPATSSASSGKASVAAITGGVVGVLVLLGAVIAVGIFYYRRRRDSANGGAFVSPFGNRRSRHSQRIRSDFDLMGDKSDPFTGSNEANATARQNAVRANLPPGHEPSPFLLSSLPPPSATYSQNGDDQSIHSHYHDAHSSVHEPAGFGSLADRPSQPTHTPQSSTSMTAAQRKRAMAGVPAYTTPSRFILHTDLEDAVPVDEGDVVELPPQYSERRAPANRQQPDSVPSNQATPTLSLHSQDPNSEAGRHLRL